MDSAGNFVLNNNVHLRIPETPKGFSVAAESLVEDSAGKTVGLFKTKLCALNSLSLVEKQRGYRKPLLGLRSRFSEGGQGF